MTKFILICFTQLLISINLFAQTGGTISGQVRDSSRRPANGATILLINAHDSTVVKTALSGADGNFSFTHLKPALYKVWVTMVGYNKYSSQIIAFTYSSDVVNLAGIVLKRNGNQLLKEVEVIGKKPFIEHKIDKVIVNVDALANTGNSALEVLEKSPGILIDPNGAISLEGKPGVKIYIDGKPSYLTGAQLQNYLQSLPASALDQIELMTNPPAKYDASGNAGIINIKTKKSKVKGFSGAFNFTYGQWFYGKVNPGFNFTYRNNKWNLFGNIEDNQQNYDNTSNNYRVFKNTDGSDRSYFSQHRFNHGKGNTINLQSGADYYASDKSTFGILIKAYIRPYNPYFSTTTILSDANHQTDSVIGQQEYKRGKISNRGINLNYHHQYNKKGHEFTADLDYLTYNIDDHILFNNTAYLVNQTLQSQDQQSSTQTSPIHIYAAKIDYTRPFAEGLQLEAGLKTSFTNTDNTAAYYDIINQFGYIDYTKSNHFIYRESINAAYVNCSKDWKRFSAEAGLRLENTVSNGHQLGNPLQHDSAFKRYYTNVFPTVYFQYKLDSAANNLLGLNYGRRIGRPNYQDLNPFITPQDQFTFDAGDSYLKPSFSQDIELSHTYKNNLTTKISYSKSTNDIYATTELKNGIYYNRPANIGSFTTESISVNGSFAPAKWLSGNLFAAYLYVHAKTEFYTGVLDSHSGFVLANGVVNMKFSKSWSAVVNGFYQSPRKNVQVSEAGYGRVNVSVLKKFGNNIMVKVGVGDVFKTYQLNGTVHNLVLAEGGYHNVYDTRGFTINFGYRFGKIFNDHRKHQGNAAESEQGRINN